MGIPGIPGIRRVHGYRGYRGVQHLGSLPTMRGTAATRGAVLWFLVVLLYAALSAARLVAAEADEPCWPASATSPPLLGQSRRAPFARRLTAFQCRARH